MIDSDQGQRIARTRHACTIAPDLIAHIVSLIGTTTKSNQPRVQTSRDAPVPVNVDAVDDADYVYQALTYWTGVFATQLRLRTATLLRNARRTADGTIVGFPSSVTPATAHAATRALTQWMLEHLDHIATHAPFELRDFTTETDRILTLRSKWPIEEGGVQSQVPCPHHDDPMPIVMYPPLEYGMPRVIVCDGSHYYDEDELGVMERQHLADIRQRIIDKRRTTKIMNKLMDDWRKTGGAA